MKAKNENVKPELEKLQEVEIEAYLIILREITDKNQIGSVQFKKSSKVKENLEKHDMIDGFFVQGIFTVHNQQAIVQTGNLKDLKEIERSKIFEKMAVKGYKITGWKVASDTCFRCGICSKYEKPLYVPKF